MLTMLTEAVIRDNECFNNHEKSKQGHEPKHEEAPKTGPKRGECIIFYCYLVDSLTKSSLAIA